MITFKQFLTEAISKDSVIDILPEDEVKKISQKLSLLGVDFESLNFKRAKKNDFKVISLQYHLSRNFKFYNLPSDYAVSLKSKRPSQRKAVVLIAANAQQRTAFIVWGIKPYEKSIIYMNKHATPISNGPRCNEDIIENMEQLLNNENTVKYYVIVDPIKSIQQK